MSMSNWSNNLTHLPWLFHQVNVFSARKRLNCQLLHQANFWEPSQKLNFWWMLWCQTIFMFYTFSSVFLVSSVSGWKSLHQSRRGAKFSFLCPSRFCRTVSDNPTLLASVSLSVNRSKDTVFEWSSSVSWETWWLLRDPWKNTNKQIKINSGKTLAA